MNENTESQSPKFVWVRDIDQTCVQIMVLDRLSDFQFLLLRRKLLLMKNPHKFKTTQAQQDCPSETNKHNTIVQQSYT